jgi:starch-binding outer membrane protein SusE/F
MKTKLLLLLAVVMSAFSVNAQLPAGTTVAVVGAGVGGWPGDPGNPGPIDVHQMTSTDNINWTVADVVCIANGAKFRANNSWSDDTLIWGSAAFPTGTASSPGDNINITIPGTYTINFNSNTKEYSFVGGVPIPVVKLVGSAVTGGSITMNPTSPTTFALPLTTFLDGTAQFEIDGVLQVGGNTFPGGDILTGTAITIPAGQYTSVTYDNDFSTYLFVAAPLFPSVALVGAGAGGWPGDPGNPGPIDINQLTTTDFGVTYTGTFTLTAGEIKFRANNAWDTSWGGLTFPTGPDPANAGSNIVVTMPGTYDVTFTRATGAYVFSMPTIALVGSGAGGWPGDPGNPGPIDLNQLTSTDGLNYVLDGIVLTNGEAKYRANNDWAKNWGGTALNAALVLGGANIPTTAGTFNISFNRVSGQSTITPSLSTTNFGTSGFKVYPNPSNNVWNFTSAKEAIVSVQVIDMLGKVVATSATTIVDASALNAGVYFAKVTSANATATVKVVKN